MKRIRNILLTNRVEQSPISCLFLSGPGVDTICWSKIRKNIILVIKLTRYELGSRCVGIFLFVRAPRPVREPTQHPIQSVKMVLTQNYPARASSSPPPASETQNT